MWDNIRKYVEENHMIEEGDSVLIGVSGGADSVCLLRYFLSIRKKMKLAVFAVHVNHLLREEEAERDQRFTEELCEKWSVPLKIFRKNIKEESKRMRCSLEEAGRMIRYECFKEAAGDWHCNKIAVAHHRNDLAETMVFRMTRGTGITGLSGIAPVNGSIIRPFLGVDKSEILEILEKLGQNYVEDSTNQQEMYSRNCIRHRILPEMQNLNMQAVAHLGQLSNQIREFNDYLEPIFMQLFEDNIICRERSCIFPEEKFQGLKFLEKKEMFRRMLFLMAGQRKDIASVHVEELMELMEKRPGKRISLPYELIAERTPEGVLVTNAKDFYSRPEAEPQSVEDTDIFVDKQALEQTGQWITSLEKGRKMMFHLKEMGHCKIIKSDCVKYFDYDTIKSKLCLRTRQPGDYFIMDQEGRHKSLKRYFIDEKIPAKMRDQILLLTEGAHVLWITGGRISEGYKVGAKTKRILMVQMTGIPEEK